jgi:hypothetical protein
LGDVSASRNRSLRRRRVVFISTYRHYGSAGVCGIGHHEVQANLGCCRTMPARVRESRAAPTWCRSCQTSRNPQTSESRGPQAPSRCSWGGHDHSGVAFHSVSPRVYKMSGAVKLIGNTTPGCQEPALKRSAEEAPASPLLMLAGPSDDAAPAGLDGDTSDASPETFSAPAQPPAPATPELAAAPAEPTEFDDAEWLRKSKCELASQTLPERLSHPSWDPVKGALGPRVPKPGRASSRPIL